MDNLRCESEYTVWEGLILKCERHLYGNVFRNNDFKHAAQYLGTSFYWSEQEADNKKENHV